MVPTELKFVVHASIISGVKECESFIPKAGHAAVIFVFLWFIASALSFVVHSKYIIQRSGRTVWVSEEI